jgi:hypothetical protein
MRASRLKRVSVAAGDCAGSDPARCRAVPSAGSVPTAPTGPGQGTCSPWRTAMMFDRESSTRPGKSSFRICCTPRATARPPATPTTPTWASGRLADRGRQGLAAGATDRRGAVRAWQLRERKVSAHIVNRRLSALTASTSGLMRHEIVESDPVYLADKPKRPLRIPVWLEREEQARLEATIKRPARTSRSTSSATTRPR